MDGNTTDGDGGAIYTDEDGDVTVIDSTVNGSTADGPGGAIFTLDGDVTIINSTLSGNRADDRGGAISGEAAVTLINSTITRNLAVAHVGGGVWARGNLYVANSTITNNYAEGKGGGVLAAGVATLVNSTVADNIAPIAANVGAGERLDGVRLGDRAGQGRRARRPDAADRRQLRDAGDDVATATTSSPTRRADSRAWAIPSGAASLLGRRRSRRCPAALRSTASRSRPAGRRREPSRWRASSTSAAVSRALLAADQRGVARPQGAGCDAGAVEVRDEARARVGSLALAARGRGAAPRGARAGDEDSPWPRLESTRRPGARDALGGGQARAAASS